MTDAKGQGKSVEELFPCPFFTGAETGQCKSNGSLYAARHLWEEAAKRLKGQIKGQTEKRSPKPYGFRLLSGSGRRIRTLTYGVRVRCATFTQSRYVPDEQDLLYSFSGVCQHFFALLEKIFQGRHTPALEGKRKGQRQAARRSADVKYLRRGLYSRANTTRHRMMLGSM